MKKFVQWTVLIMIVVAIVILGLARWQNGKSRRIALSVIKDFSLKLSDPRSVDQALNLLVLPQFIRDRTRNEQIEFIRKALADEISLDGIAALQQQGRFGSLKEIFPERATNWANQAGVRVDDCVAFKLERNSQVTEVVLVSNLTNDIFPGYQIIRVNNVR